MSWKRKHTEALQSILEDTDLLYGKFVDELLFFRLIFFLDSFYVKPINKHLTSSSPPMVFELLEKKNLNFVLMSK